MSEKKTNAMRILDKNKIPYEHFTYEYDEDHIDAVSVANQLGQDLKYVYKTLVLQGADKNYYVCVIQSDDELDFKKIAKFLGIKNIDMIHVNDINKVTGYIRGGCSPVGMKKLYKTVINSSAKDLDYIIVSAGQRGMQIKLKVEDLVKLVNASIADIVK